MLPVPRITDASVLFSHTVSPRPLTLVPNVSVPIPSRHAAVFASRTKSIRMRGVGVGLRSCEQMASFGENWQEMTGNVTHIVTDLTTGKLRLFPEDIQTRMKAYSFYARDRWQIHLKPRGRHYHDANLPGKLGAAVVPLFERVAIQRAGVQGDRFPDCQGGRQAGSGLHPG